MGANFLGRLMLLLALALPAHADELRNPYRDYVVARVAAMGSGVAQPSDMGPARPEIVGGKPAWPSMHRFQVALLFAGLSSNYDALYCGGSLIFSRFVITAAHCSDFVSTNGVRVLAGTQLLDGSGKRYRVKSIRVHPKWNPATFDYDIAVWTLAEDVPNMPKLYFARRDPAVGTKMVTTGWGYTSEGGPVSRQLMQVSVPLTGRATCNDANSYDGWITGRMLCAGYDGGGKDSCAGDSGGPLTAPRAEGGRILTGLVSWGNGCARPDYYGVYTRISNPEIRSFIANAVWPWPVD